MLHIETIPWDETNVVEVEFKRMGCEKLPFSDADGKPLKAEIVFPNTCAYLDSLAARTHKAEEENRALRLLMGRIQAGERITIRTEDVDQFTREKLDAELNAVQNWSVERFIYDHWDQIGGCKCGCGNTIDYDASHDNRTLSCVSCAEKGFLNPVEQLCQGK